MRFLVFVPKNGTHPSLQDVGLECLTGDGEPSPETIDCDSFPPAGMAGRIYGWPSKDLQGLPIYQPDLQTWIPAAPDPARQLPGKRYWLGLWNDSPPTASDLARPSVVEGRMRLKAPSGIWQVPSLLNLPCALELDSTTGLPVRIPKPEHASWRADAAWGLDLMLKLMRGETDVLPLAQMFEVAVRILQMNYRLPRELVHRLGLLRDEDILQSILTSAADQDAIRAAVKELTEKKATPETLEVSGSFNGDAG